MRVQGDAYARVLSEKLAEGLAPPRRATERIIHGESAFPGKVTAVVGMRRTGKTTYLHQLRREALAAGMPSERLPFVNFEDERLSGMGADGLSILLEEYYRRFPAFRSEGRVFWHFDEIQVVPGWERFLRRLVDSERVELRISGSSAALLSREIATALRGRAWEVSLYPFGFEEALRHAGHPVPSDPSFLSGSERSALERRFAAWLASGGFPEVQGVVEETRRTILSDYVDVAILRDVVERHGVSNVAALRAMVRQLLGNSGSPFSVEKLHASLKSMGLAVGKDSVHQFLAHLEDSYLVAAIWVDSASERRRMLLPRKAYPIDSGLIHVYDRSGRPQTGHALETMVLVELLRRHADVRYVRTESGREVDFIARFPSGRPELIQVCADLSDPDTLERELRSLLEAAAQYPDARRLILTLNRSTGLSGFAEPAGSAGWPDGIEVLPAYEWMLSS